MQDYNEEDQNLSETEDVINIKNKKNKGKKKKENKSIKYKTDDEATEVENNPNEKKKAKNKKKKATTDIDDQENIKNKNDAPLDDKNKKKKKKKDKSQDKAKDGTANITNFFPSQKKFKNDPVEEDEKDKESQGKKSDDNAKKDKEKKEKKPKQRKPIIYQPEQDEQMEDQKDKPQTKNANKKKTYLSNLYPVCKKGGYKDKFNNLYEEENDEDFDFLKARKLRFSAIEKYKKSHPEFTDSDDDGEDIVDEYEIKKKELQTKSKKKQGKGKARILRHTQINQNSFTNFVQEIANKYPCGKHDLQFTVEGMELFQAATEDYLKAVFEDSYLCAIHANRVTMSAEDMRLAMHIRADFNK